MKPYLIICLILSMTCTGLMAQQPGDSAIRVVDTLSATQKVNRSPVILRSELDSLKAVYYPDKPQGAIREPVTAASTIPMYWLWIAVLFGVAIIAALFLIWKSQQRSAHAMAHLDGILHKYLAARAEAATEAVPAKQKGGKEPDKKSQQLLAKLADAEAALAEASHQQAATAAELDELKQQLTQVYKVRNYPGYSKDKSEAEVLEAFLRTERSVAAYGYENFLKPLHAIADENKNNPARIRQEDQQRILELVVSLGLFYAEYLYLRVNELAIGGKMIQRLGSLEKGNGLDKSLLKELNTEHGSRALALRVALDKMGIHHLSYPVFDETNLNQS